MPALDQALDLLKNAEPIVDYVVPVAVSILIAVILVIIGVFYLTAKLDEVERDRESASNDKNNPAQ